MSKIIIKACQGWKYRVIVADDEGNCDYDDVKCIKEAAIITERLIIEIEKKKKEKEGGSHENRV